MSFILSKTKKDFLSFWVKLAYGTGGWSTASYETLRQNFYAIFLTDLVGLDAHLASFTALDSSIP
jgi:Na+/melibiose symporter-like transporter